MKYKIGLLFLWVLGCLSHTLQAQDCKDALRRAIEMYEKGHLNEVRTILSDGCIKTLDTKEKEEAYYLLAVASLYMKDLDSAKASVLTILNGNPEYVCRMKTPLGFQKFYETFKTNPIVIFGGRVGANASAIKSIKSYSLDDATVGQQGSYQHDFGFQLSGTLTLPINKRIDLIGELGFKRFTYQFKNTLFGFSEIRIQEKQSMIELPVMVRFNFANHYIFHEHRSFLNKMNPYVIAGASLTYLITSNALAFRKDNLNTERGFETNKQINMTNMRQKIGYYAIGGLGIEYKQGRGIWSLEGRYNYGFAPVVKAKNRYINSDLLFSYGYVDSDMKLRNLSFSVGYAYPIYRPKQQRSFYIEDLSPNDLPKEQPEE